MVVVAIGGTPCLIFRYADHICNFSRNSISADFGELPAIYLGDVRRVPSQFMLEIFWIEFRIIIK